MATTATLGTASPGLGATTGTAGGLGGGPMPYGRVVVTLKSGGWTGGLGRERGRVALTQAAEEHAHRRPAQETAAGPAVQQGRGAGRGPREAAALWLRLLAPPPLQPLLLRRNIPAPGSVL